MKFTIGLRSFFVIFLVLLILATYSWFQASGSLLLYPEDILPPGQMKYIFSKLFGLFAIIFFWLQICLGLLQNDSFQKQKITPSIHITLGVLTLVMMLVHFVLFVLAVWERKEVFPVNLLLPNLSDYYHVGLFFGQLAIVLTLLVVVAGRNSLKQGLSKLSIALWGNVHRLSLVIFALILVHSYMIGSETREFVVFYIYLFMLVSVLALVIRKLYVR